MKIKCTPELGTVQTNIIERTIGRAVAVDTATAPLGPASTDLLGDTFHCLYGMEFEPMKDEEAPQPRLVNHALMKWLKRDKEFMQTRSHTSGKLILSLMASKTLYEYLLTDEAIREALKAQEPPPPTPQPVPFPSEEPQGGGGEENEDTHQEKMEQAVKRIEQIQNNVIGSQIVSNAAKEAGETAKETENVLQSWGIDPGDVNIADLDEIMKLINHNDEKMDKISELAGRFEGVCSRALEKVRQAYTGQIVDVHRTQDFSQMFAPELCYMMSPDVPQLIHTRYVDDFLSHGLLGFELRSEGKEFGNLFVMVDGSGSMDPKDGGFEIQAKAIAMGLARSLKKDKLSDKEYTLCTFGASRDPMFSVTSNDSMNEHYKWAEKFQGGGTNFDSAFREAIKRLKGMPSGTDLVFITDGQCQLSLEMEKTWSEYKEATGTRLLYVDVSGQDNYTLHKLCDLYLRISFKESGDMDMVAEGIADTLATSIERQRLDKSQSQD